MISFDQFLAESRSAPLFHGTSSNIIDRILDIGLIPATKHASNYLMKTHTTREFPYYVRGVSTSRSFNTAKGWSTAVIGLDQQKLAQRYQIKPMQFWQGLIQPARKPDWSGGTNEYEEFVITDKPIPNTYITSIFLSPYAYGAEHERFKQLQRQYDHIDWRIFK